MKFRESKQNGRRKIAVIESGIAISSTLPFNEALRSGVHVKTLMPKGNVGLK
jgi:hypothetical protein